jgi:hypothetical protein
VPLLSDINANTLSLSGTSAGRVYGPKKIAVADLLIKTKPKTTIYTYDIL